MASPSQKAESSGSGQSSPSEKPSKFRNIHLHSREPVNPPLIPMLRAASNGYSRRDNGLNGHTKSYQRLRMQVVALRSMLRPVHRRYFNQWIYHWTVTSHANEREKFENVKRRLAGIERKKLRRNMRTAFRSWNRFCEGRQLWLTFVDSALDACSRPAGEPGRSPAYGGGPPAGVWTRVAKSTSSETALARVLCPTAFDNRSWGFQ